jgi:hypothetical protein
MEMNRLLIKCTKRFEVFGFFNTRNGGSPFILDNFFSLSREAGP